MKTEEKTNEPMSQDPKPEDNIQLEIETVTPDTENIKPADPDDGSKVKKDDGAPPEISS